MQMAFDIGFSAGVARPRAPPGGPGRFCGYSLHLQLLVIPAFGPIEATRQQNRTYS